MSEQRCDRVQAHASVHGLCCQSVSKLVSGDVADSGGVGGAAQRGGDAVVADRPIVFEQKTIGA